MQPVEHFDRTLLNSAKAWPFEEARKILKRLEKHPSKKGYALLETGYGPSGLPHIGTFGEVMRTTMVRHAFQQLSDIPTKLYSFSDDMDGFRKVPENLPNQKMLTEHLHKPLTKVPDPFEKYESLGHHNNAKLREFLDHFGFDYDFQSSTEWYTSGRFDETLLKVLENYEKVMGVMLPTLGEERQATYSPFLPLCPSTGKVLHVPMKELRKDEGIVIYEDPETNKLTETPVTGGHCKLQWKIDWAMRWTAFDVDYEMSGKDLIDSVKVSNKICRILGGHPPENLTYELFLDEKGQKISKSKGNGITIDEWLTYAPSESLGYYMYQAPKRAKRLYFDVIPKAMDEYLTHLSKYTEQEPAKKIENPVYHLHSGNVPKNDKSQITFALLLNLASVCNADNADILWGFVKKYDETATKETHPLLNTMISNAVAYYQDFIKPKKEYRAASDQECSALNDLVTDLSSAAEHDAQTLQGILYEVGKKHNFDNLRDWFKALYEVLLGQKEGPRMGSFIALYGVDNMIKLIKEKLG